MPKTILIDISNLAYRFYFLNKENTGEVIARTLLGKITPETNVFCCFDSGRVKARLDILPTYKGTRKSDPAIKEAIADTKVKLQEAGIPCLEHPDLEADDIIYNLVQLNEKQKSPREIIVVSADKDLHHSVGKYSSLIKSLTETYTVQPGMSHVQEDIPKSKWIAYKSIVGDSSDCISGVLGIGPVGAKKLIDNWTSDNLEDLKSAIRELKGDQGVSEFDISYKVISPIVDLELTRNLLLSSKHPYLEHVKDLIKEIGKLKKTT